MPGNPLTDPNWAPDLADTVERVVGKVRSTATDNAVKASRAVVFGVLICSPCSWRCRCSIILALGVIRELLGVLRAHAAGRVPVVLHPRRHADGRWLRRAARCATRETLA